MGGIQYVSLKPSQPGRNKMKATKFMIVLAGLLVVVID